MEHARWVRRPEGSNWGDFGAGDQVGRMNLVTPERRRVAAREIVTGETFVLSLPLDRPGTSLFAGRQPLSLFAVRAPDGEYHYRRPFSRSIPGATDVFSDDGVTLFTQQSTQWDALGHAGYHFDADGDGVDELVYYNGFRDDRIMVPPGAPGGPRARALDIGNLAMTGTQGRGVLVDLHAIYGRDSVAVGYDALMTALDRQKATVEPGDFLCLYTGVADLLLEMGDSFAAEHARQNCAGLDGGDRRLLRWIADSGLVAICADNAAVEKSGRTQPSAAHPASSLPLHRFCLFEQGIHLGELWYFTDLAAWLGAHGRSRFFLTAPPLRLPGALGSPATPVATV